MAEGLGALGVGHHDNLADTGSDPELDLGGLVEGLEGSGDDPAVGGTDEVPVDGPTRGGLRGGLEVDRDGPVGEEDRGVDRDTVDGQLGQGGEEALDTGLAAHVGADGDVGAVAEDLADDLGQDPARADLDEDAGPGRVHGFDLLHPADRLGHLAGHEGSDAVGVLGIEVGEGVRPHGEPGREDLDLGQMGGEGGLGPGHHGAVEGAGHGEGLGGESCRREDLDRPGHCRGGSADDGLVGGVAVGHDDIGHARPDQGLLHGGGSGHDGGHGPGIVPGCGQDGIGPGLAQGQEVGFPDGSGRGQGGQLAVAVAGGKVGTDPDLVEEVGHGHAGDPERRLGGPGVGDGGLLGRLPLRAEGRRGHEGLEPLLAQPEMAAERREGHEEVAEHAGSLAALAGEAEGHGPRSGTEPVAGVGLEDAPDPGGRRVEGGGQLGQEVVAILGHEGDLDGGGAPGHGSGEVAEPDRGAGSGEVALELGDPGHGRGPVGAPEEEELGRPSVDAPVGELVTVERGEDGVEVGASEAEAADPGDPVVGQPGSGGLLEPEGGGLGLVGRVGLLHVEGRRADAPPDGLGGLDEPGQPRRALGVADVALDRPHGAGREVRSVLPQELGQGGHLGPVTDHGAGPVRFDQPDVGGGDAGPVVGPVQGEPLPLLAGGGEAQVATVARAGHRLDHGVDPVAVAHRVGQALEDHAGHALAEDDPVGRGVEGPTAAGGRERVDRPEEEVLVDAVVEVGTAAEHHVGVAGEELLAGHVEGGQGCGTGGVDGAVHPAQVEPVGDPAGDDVGQHSGEAVLGELGEEVLERLGDTSGEGREEGAETVGTGQVGAGLGAEDDPGSAPVEFPFPVAGVGDGPGGHLEGEELDRLDGGE